MLALCVSIEQLCYVTRVSFYFTDWVAVFLFIVCFIYDNKYMSGYVQTHTKNLVRIRKGSYFGLKYPVLLPQTQLENVLMVAMLCWYADCNS